MERLMQMAAQFMEGKVLLAGAELDIFDQLAGGKGARDVAAALGADPRGTEILLDALAAIGVLRKESDTYHNLPEFEPFLTAGGRDHFLGFLRHRNRVVRNWAFLEDRVMGKPLPSVLTERGLLDDPRANENFIQAMYAASCKVAPSVVDAIDLGGVRTLADLGGGPGHYLAEFARRSTGIVPYLCDLPLTIAVARRIQAGTPEAGRIHFVEWDFYHDPGPADLPAFDLIFISAVLHAESPERNTQLLRRLHSRVAPGGRIVVQENMVESDRTSPPDAALFAINMFVSTAGGRTYTKEEISSWGREAGFAPEGTRRLSPRSCLLTLRKAGGSPGGA